MVEDCYLILGNESTCRIMVEEGDVVSDMLLKYHVPTLTMIFQHHQHEV